MGYAERTDVPVAKSKADIEVLLERHGADAVATGWDGRSGRAVVHFRMANRMMKFTINIPSRDDDEIVRTPERRRPRSKASQNRAYDQAVRSRWRALLLCIRAKIEAVESGIETIDEAFMAQIVLSDGSVVGEHVTKQIAASYETGRMPRLGLPGIGETS